MVGKNNNYVRESKSNEHFQRFALRKLSVGVVSVAVAAGFYLGSGATAQAATTEPDTSAKTEQVVQQDSTSTASDAASASNASAAVSASSTVPTSAEPVSKVTASDSAVSASSASASQVSAANASESSSQPASSSVASNTAATVSKDSQAASEANSQSAADTQTVQLPTSATRANESQAANALNAQAVRQAANQQAPAGFTVTDPTYPAEMYKDPDASHYTYWWAQSSDGEYNLVLSTDRNGDGKVHVFLLGNNNNVLGEYTVDKNKSTEIATDDEGDFGTVYNDGQSGVFVASDGTWKSKFNVFNPQAGKDERNYNSLSFMIPQVETQTTTYVNGEGNTVSDPVIQKGLDGQIYTTQGGQVINGYFAKEPSNATGYMSPFGKKNVTYTKDWHNGTKAEFTEIDTATGLMRVKVFEQGRSGRWEKVDEFDLAYGESEKVKTDYSDITIHSIYIPQTINIQYVYEKLGNLIIDSDSKAFPADDKKTTQYPNDENDSTKAGNVTIPKVAGFTPTIDGKTVTNYTFNPADYVSDLSKDINVVYVADTQEAQALFYDETTGQLIDGTRQVATGKTGEAISFTKNPSEIVKELEAKGYVFDKDNAKNKVFTTGTTYDNDSTAHQYFKYYFTHAKTIVTPDNPKTPADVLPDNPGKNYPSGVAKDDLNKTVTRTINIKTPDGKTQTTTQKAEFTRSATVDEVTGEVTYGSWSNNVVLGSADVPNIPGYTPSTSVPEITVTPNDKDMTINVTYQADQQFAHTVYLDADENNAHVPSTPGGSLPDKTVIQNVEIKGVTGGKIDYAFDAAHDQNYAAISNYYNLKSVDVPSTFDNDDDKDQIVYVYLTHRTEDVSNTDPQAKTTATRTINVTTPDGKTSSEKQIVNYKRTATEDLVTGNVTYGKWQADGAPAWQEYTPTPQKGYTTLIDGVAGTKVDQKTPAFNGDKPVDETVNVTYQADAQRAVIEYIDGETGNDLQKPDTVDGHTNETINYSTADKIKYYEAQGYELFKDNFPAGEKFDNDDKTNQTYTVIFKHHRENVDPNHSSADGTKGTKTLTETVHYKYADGTKAAEDQTAQVTFTRNGVLDDVTGIVAWGKWNEASQSYKALTSPTIAGYTPSEAVVKRSSNSDAEQGPTVTVIYTADAQKVHVQYIDGETDKLLRQDDLDGYTDETIPYSTAEGIKKFEGDGYELFKDNFPAGEKFDNDDKTDQTYTVIFKHHRENVDPNHSSADGTKGTKTLTETVHYKYANGTKAAEDQTAQVTFTRNGVLDDVTGIVAWGKWNEASQSYKALTSPTIAGYTPSEAVVKRSSNSDAEQGPTVPVIYTADAQTAYVKYVDDTTGETLRQDDLHGYTDETIPYSTAEGIKKYEGDGYVLVSDGFKPGTKFGVGTPTYEVHFKHGTTHTDATDKNAEQKIVTETIHYVYENNQTAKPDYTSAVDFKRGYTTDNVTGKVVSYDPWTVSSKKFGVVKSPIIEGYTPNYSQIDEITVTPDSKDVVKTVVYVGNAQEAQAIFYDETTGKEISGTREIATGKSDETINFTKDPSEIVKELEAKGYVFDKSNANNKVFVDGSTYDKNSEVHQYFKYYFTHGHATVTPEQDPQKGQKTVTQTIKYEYADGTATGLADNVQTLTFKRTGDEDLVTHEVTWPDWSTVAAQQTSVVTSPALKGYTADTSEIPAVTYHAGDSDVTYVVKYSADAQRAVINYIDGESDEILHTDKVNGHSDEKINYSTADMIKQLEAKGYELYKDNFSADEKFDNDDATDQTYTVIFKHHRENVDPNHSSADGTKGTKTLTETVHYKYADGTKAAEDQTAQVTFTRNGVLDDVTGIVAWGKWNEASQSYKALTSPTIAGYTPSEAVVKRSSNSDAEQGPTLTVIYTADAQKVHVQYIDGETDKLLRQDDLDGYTDETIPYSTAEGIKKFEGDGYELFKDNFPAGEKFDNDDKNDQTYTVIFKHHRENVDPNHSSADGTKGTKTLTETVHYKYADGTKAAEDQTAQVTFTRNGVLDDVTGIVAWGKWNEASQSYKVLTSPTIAGYTPSEAVVKRSSNSDAEQGPTLTVIYTADAQTAYVKYVDDTTGETLRQDDLHGYTDETIPYSTAEGIKKYEGDGYVLVSDGFKPGTKFGVGTPTYEVHFKHGTTHTDATDENADQKTVTETIHYVDENNQTVQPDYTTAVTFKRGYTTDNVTGKVVSYDPWTVDGKQADSKTFAAVTSPAVEGYTPNHQQINEFTVTPDSKDIVKTVVYVGDPQEAQAIFYDETTGKEISNTREIVNGKTDETISFTKDPNEVVKELEKQGYVFDKDNANNNVFVAGTTYDKNSEVHQYFKYYFTHATTIVTPDNPKTPADVLPDNPGKNYPSGVAKDDLNKTVTRTINITTPDGKTQTITQKAEFTRSATVDEVTGEVTYGPWSKNVVLESVDVPNIPGYVPSASVPEITVTPNDQDMTINITYKKLDSGKATDQGGNASNGGQATNGGSTTGQSAQNGQSGQTQNNAGAQQLPQTGNANNEKGALGLAGAMFAAGLGLGFGSKKKRHEN